MARLKIIGRCFDASVIEILDRGWLKENDARIERLGICYMYIIMFNQCIYNMNVYTLCSKVLNSKRTEIQMRKT